MCDIAPSGVGGRLCVAKRFWACGDMSFRLTFLFSRSLNRLHPPIDYVRKAFYSFVPEYDLIDIAHL